MTYETPCLRPLALESASASCCTPVIPTVIIFDKVVITGSC